MASDNRFERLRDRAEARFKGLAEATDKAFGVGQRPYGTVHLTPQQKIEYFKAQPDEKKLEIWQQMDEDERQEIGRALMGQQPEGR